MGLPAVPSSAPLPLDAVPSPVAAYGFRKLRTEYAGNCVRVRESGGNTLANIPFTAAGNLDEAALLAHCGSNDAFIETWYDQSGNSVNLTQATNGSQPKLVSAGVIHREGSRIFISAGNQNLAGTLGSAIAANSITVVTVVKNTSADTSSNRFTIFELRSGSSPCFSFRASFQSMFTYSYTTPGGSAYQTGDNPDRPMLWHDFEIVSITADATPTIKHWRNNKTSDTWTPTQTGASGTGLWLGAASGFSVVMSELIIYGSALSASQVGTLYESVNQYHTIGPINENPVVALEERHSWDTVLRRWMRGLTEAELAVTPGTFTWDGTRSDTNQLLRIYLHAHAGYSSQTKHTEGLLIDAKWWRLFAENEIGIESDYPLFSQSVISPGIIRQFVELTTSGSEAARWANWYSWNLPKAAGAQGNPFYRQRGVALRALMDSCVTLIQKSKQADISTFDSAMDIFGGTLNMCAWVFKQCRDEMPLHVQNAFIDALRYSVKRLSFGPRYVNANMDCKGIQALATIYTIVPDDATKQLCIDNVKLALFGSTTGTPDTANGFGIFDPAGHIAEGGANALTPETTYNGHSDFHLIGALTHVWGDPEWDFLETVVDRMARFKYAQYFPQPDGQFDGPSGYAGRTGGSRVYDQGNEVETYICRSAFSVYGRPGDDTLPAESGLVDDINDQIALLNTKLSFTAVIHDGTGMHTDGVDCFVRECTVQVDPANTLTNAGHNLPNGTAGHVSVVSGGTIAAPLVAGVYYVVNADENTFQLAATEGGAAITLTSAGTKNLLFRPLAYLTDNPNLNYTPEESCDAFLVATVGGTEYAGQISYVDDTANVVTILGHLNVPSGSPVDYEIVNGPKRWISPGQHWPVQGGYFPPDGYYDAQRARIVGNDASLKMPFEKTADFNDWYNDDWWIYKATNASSREYGWMVECLDKPGDYDGWFGGTLQEFWTRDGGSVIRCSHDKSGSEVNQDENTRVWAEIDQWATHHVWGKDSSAKRFSNAPSSNTTFTRTIDKVGPPISAEISATNTTDWLESGTAITGTFTVTNTFETAAGGLRIQTTVAHTGTDSISELWATLPVFLKYADEGSADTVIEYWTGAAWNPVPTTLVTTSTLRLGRDFGSGVKYVWIEFSTAQDVKISDAVWTQSYQNNGRFRNIKCDLLGYTGSAQSWPAESSVDYAVTSVDPGLVPTEPSISITYPDVDRVLPAGGFWMVKGEVGWVDDPGTVTAEYTTNGSTWTEIGELTNTTGNTWEWTGGTIPTGVIGLRLRATPSVGDEGVLAIDVTSATYSLVVEDNFTASDDTAVNAGYTSWTTNTTGNSYQILTNGGVDHVRINTNRATHNQVSGDISSKTIGIDIGTPDSIVEGVLNMATSNSQAFPGVCSRVVSGYSNGERCACSISSGFHFEFRPRFNGGLSPELSLTIPSFNINNPYRLVLQTVGDAACASVYDGVTLVGTLYKFGLSVGVTNERVGFTAPALAASAYIDDFKVYTP